MTVGFAVAGAGQAQAQELCSFYSVARGDTLSLIAQRADVPGGFQALFDANTDVLANAATLEVDQVLRIPCEDGGLPVAAAPAPAAPAVEAGRPLRIITATSYAPFTDEGLPGGGILTQMVTRAMELGNPGQEFTLFFVNDWGAHLDDLLPSGAVDMSFPWFKPDCDRVANLSPESAARCTDFNHSAPFYEALVGFYAVAGSPFANATSYDELIGARLCRPEAWFTFDLEAVSLMPPNVTLTRPVPQNGCWQLLMDGQVDVVTLDALPAEEDFRDLGLEGRIAKIEPLTSAQTFHIFVSKDNQIANQALPIINAGLEQLRLSGEWFNIAREGIMRTVED